MLLPAMVDLYFIWLKYTYSYIEVCGCCFESNQHFSFSLQVSPWLAFYHFNRGITWVYTSLVMYYFYQRKAEYWLIRRYLHIYSLFATCLIVYLIVGAYYLDQGLVTAAIQELLVVETSLDITRVSRLSSFIIVGLMHII